METINLRSAPTTKNIAELPGRMLFEEFRRVKPSLDALGIGFSVSRAKTRVRGEKQGTPPYFACCYNLGNLGNVNVVAFYYSLVADWNQMEGDVDQYRKRIHSALREETIHGIQVLTVKERYERSDELRRRFDDAETYYDYILGTIIEELATSNEGEKTVLTAAKLYYEHWAINSMEELRQADRRYHGRDGYLVSELIRQIVQIRFGELITEEAKGRAWDKHRIFFAGEYGTTENLMKAMASTLRQAVPQLINLSPALAEALTGIEDTIQTIAGISAPRFTAFQPSSA